MNPLPFRSSPVLRWGAITFAALSVFAGVAALLLRHYAEPIARRRIVRSVVARLGAPATLDEVHVTFRPGLRITGRGLRVTGTGAQPSIAVRSFAFATNFGSLFRQETTLVNVAVDGLSVVVPPGEDHAAPAPAPTAHTHGEHGRFMVAQVVATNSELVIQNGDARQYPLTFHFWRVVIDDLGEGKPIHFDAVVANPRPIGDVHVHGLMGPCDPQKPRETAVSGRFDFAQADLASINGVFGHLHGEGTLNGSVGLLGVDGNATMADFGMAPGLVRVKLETHFHAGVNALTGAVTLQPVTAHVLHTDITAQGVITRVAAGHDIQLESELKGRAEDLLDLVSPTRGRPLLSAGLTDKATIHVPPGRTRMLLKMELSGTATLAGVRWGDTDVQEKVDELSMKAQDKAAEVKDGEVPVAASTLTNRFRLSGGVLALSGIDYKLPGATVLMDGTYSLPAEALDFHGIVRTAAEASHMTTGIKSLLLKPLDPLLKKKGAGMQLPVALTGPKSGLKLGLDLGHRKADDRLTPVPRK